MPMTTEDPTDDRCDLISTYYSDVCQVMVPSTTQRAYEMCPAVYADLADENGEIVCPVDDTQCYQATLCDGVMGITYQCDDLIAAAENMPAKDLCPCTCAEEDMTTAEPEDPATEEPGDITYSLVGNGMCRDDDEKEIPYIHKVSGVEKDACESACSALSACSGYSVNNIDEGVGRCVLYVNLEVEDMADPNARRAAAQPYVDQVNAMGIGEFSYPNRNSEGTTVTSFHPDFMNQCFKKVDCSNVVCTAVVCNDGSAAPVPEGECCGNVDACPETPDEDLTTEEPDTGEESDDSEEAEEPSDTTTEAVVIPDNTPAPTKEVKVQMKLSMTDEQYEEKKGEVKTSVSKKFEVAENLITINKVAGRRRSLRRILSEVNLEVGIQTHEEDRVTAIIDEADFAADMGERVSAETGLTVTVSGVEKLPTVDVTSGDTAVDDGSDDDTDMTWLWIVLAVVGVLACGGIAYVVINTQDGAQGEKGDIGGEGLGGESLGGEGEETKRSPGAQAMHDKL